MRLSIRLKDTLFRKLKNISLNRPIDDEPPTYNLAAVGWAVELAGNLEINIEDLDDLNRRLSLTLPHFTPLKPLTLHESLEICRLTDLAAADYPDQFTGIHAFHLARAIDYLDELFCGFAEYHSEAANLWKTVPLFCPIDNPPTLLG